jgi:cobalt-precorrin 5A hydrolase
MSVAEKFGVRVVSLPQSELRTASDRAATRSQRVAALTGVPSVAETAALAAAGPTARLLATRRIVGGATCALAASGSGDAA